MIESFPGDSPDLHGLDLRPALEETCRILLDLTRADQVLVYVRQANTTLYDPLYALGRFSLPEKQAFWSNPLDTTTDVLADEITNRFEPLSIDASETRTRYTVSILGQLQAGCFLALPLHNRSQSLGFLLLGWQSADHRIPPGDLAVIRAVSRSLALALDNARLVDLASQQLFQTLRLHEISAAILNKIDLREALHMIGAGALQLTAAAGCVIRLLDENGDLMVVHQSGAPLQPKEEVWQPQSVLSREEPLLFNLPTEDVLAQPDGALLALPLRDEDGQGIGVLELYQKRRYLSAADLNIVRAFASQAALAIQQARLHLRIQQTAAAEERARMARDLHDSISQTIYAASLYARAAERQLASGNLTAAQDHLTEISTSIRAALTEIRLLIFELRPPQLEQAGLSGALYHRLKSVEERAGIQVEWEDRLDAPLPRALEETLYRIAQEALNNILKHAHAGQISLRLHQSPRQVSLRIADNGAGFDPQGGQFSGMGLKIMRERAQQINARLNIHSQPGQGTVISVEVPYGEDSHSAGG